MKYLNYLFISYCICAAALQYNDPDPYIWIPIYLYTAWLCLLAIKRVYRPVWYIAGLVIYSAYAIYLLFDKTGVLNWAVEHKAESLVQTMKTTKPWIEESREFFGLLLLIIILLTNMYWLRKKLTR